MQSKIAACSHSKYKIVWNNTELLGKYLRGSYDQLIHWLKIFWNWVLALILYNISVLKVFSELPERFFRALWNATSNAFIKNLRPWFKSSYYIFKFFSGTTKTLQTLYHQKLRKFPGKLPVTETSFCSKVRIILEVCQTLQIELFVKMGSFSC